MVYTEILIGLLIFIAGVLSIELYISAAVLEIIAGVIGYNVFHLEPPVFFDFIAQFGLLGIMFFAGLETDTKILKRHIRSSLQIGIMGYLFPFAGVFFISHVLLKYSIALSILISLSLSTTSLALVYAVLREQKTNIGESKHVILGSAMIIDMLSMLTLTLLIGYVSMEMLLYAIVLIVILVSAKKFGPRLIERYKGSEAELEIRFILLLLLIIPFFSEKLMVSEAVFAYLIGLILSDISEHHEVLVEKMRGIVFGFLGPAFFFKAGLLINLSFFSIELLLLISAFTLIAYLFKFIGVYLASRNIMGDKKGKMAGLYFNFRLSFGIAAAIIGLSIGLLSIELYTIIVLVVLITSLISTVLLKLYYREPLELMEY